MSISPTHLQGSQPSSSSPTPSSNPNPNHGLPHPPRHLGSPPQHLSAPDRPSPPASSDVGVSAAADTGGSSRKVTNMRRSNGPKSTRSQFSGNHFQYHSAGRGRVSPQLQDDHVGNSQPCGELSGGFSSPQSQPTSRTVGFHSSVTNSSARKNQSINANHLLNFQYDRISRPQPRPPPPPRRQQKLRPYNKDLFLQANYRFVVLDSGNHAVELMDADKMIQWENVICVRYSTPHPVQCPICLESPLCPQITSCGHIFCFPCILRYLLMGEEDHKGDCWKKCPLCFMMISLKDIYTIYIENVKHFQPGDVIQFTLLTRQKDSLIPSQKDQHGICSTDYNNFDLSDNFSKFSLTSNVEMSTREACSELKDWLARAESGLVDDLQQLPYVCAALEQLEQRKKFWTEMRSLTCSPPLGNSPDSVTKAREYSSKTESHTSSSMKDVIDSNVYGTSCPTPCISQNDKSKWSEGRTPDTIDREVRGTEIGESFESYNGEEKSSSSYEEEKDMQRHSKDSRHTKERDSYSFYQAVDGQHLILHPLNMKCLLQHYGSYDLLPPRISGKILQLETVTQTDVMRRRYRYLSHFSLTTTFQLCEIQMSELLPSDALLSFMDEIKKRENQRKKLARKEIEEKVKAEAASMPVPVPSGFGGYSVEKTFSMDDFEALGSAPLSLTPPVSGERKRFSDVTRLGFAAAHDSPLLKAEESGNVSSVTEGRGETSGPRNMVTLSFANVISTAKTPESREAPKVEAQVGKKGKKPSRVLLSTAGGRRY